YRSRPRLVFHLPMLLPHSHTSKQLCLERGSWGVIGFLLLSHQLWQNLLLPSYFAPKAGKCTFCLCWSYRSRPGLVFHLPMLLPHSHTSKQLCLERGERGVHGFLLLSHQLRQNLLLPSYFAPKAGKCTFCLCWSYRSRPGLVFHLPMLLPHSHTSKQLCLERGERGVHGFLLLSHQLRQNLLLPSYFAPKAGKCTFCLCWSYRSRPRLVFHLPMLLPHSHTSKQLCLERGERGVHGFLLLSHQLRQNLLLPSYFAPKAGKCTFCLCWSCWSRPRLVFHLPMLLPHSPTSKQPCLERGQRGVHGFLLLSHQLRQNLLLPSYFAPK